MARPRSDDKHSAILAAATRVFAAEGLGAATAAIAKEAGVSNGSLFTYFETKSALLNQLYLQLKAEMGAAAMAGMPEDEHIRGRALRMWTQWLKWAIENPAKRQTLERLMVSEELTPESHQKGSQTMAGIREILEQCRANGPMRDAPMGFVSGLMSALANATIQYMVAEPARAEEHLATGFEAFWRVVH
jgi:AcrR family transcriptional regulator